MTLHDNGSDTPVAELLIRDEDRKAYQESVAAALKVFVALLEGEEYESVANAVRLVMRRKGFVSGIHISLKRRIASFESLIFSSEACQTIAQKIASHYGLRYEDVRVRFETFDTAGLVDGDASGVALVVIFDPPLR